MVLSSHPTKVTELLSPPLLRVPPALAECWEISQKGTLSSLQLPLLILLPSCPHMLDIGPGGSGCPWSCVWFPSGDLLGESPASVSPGGAAVGLATGFPTLRTQILYFLPLLYPNFSTPAFLEVVSHLH